MTNEEFKEKIEELWDKLKTMTDGNFYLKIVCTDEIDGKFDIEVGRPIYHNMLVQGIHYTVYKDIVKDLSFFVSGLYNDMYHLKMNSNIYLSIL